MKDQRVSLHLSICFSSGNLNLSLQKHSICIQKSCSNVSSKVLQFFREWLIQNYADFTFLLTVIREKIASGKSRKKSHHHQKLQPKSSAFKFLQHTFLPNTHSSHVCIHPRLSKMLHFNLHLSVLCLQYMFFLNIIY